MHSPPITFSEHFGGLYALADLPRGGVYTRSRLQKLNKGLVLDQLTRDKPVP